jgi:protein transport protein SEC24
MPVHVKQCTILHSHLATFTYDATGVQATRARFQLPIGAIVHPLAGPQDVPEIPLSSAGIVRCKRCRTYINPFVHWIDGGRWATSLLPALNLSVQSYVIPAYVSGCSLFLGRRWAVRLYPSL